MSDSVGDRLVKEPPTRKGTRGRQEVQHDMAKVEGLMREGVPTYVIAQKFATGKRPLTRRTIERYMRAVREHWKCELLLRSETAREERIMQLQETRAMFVRERKAVIVDGKVLHQGSRYDATIARYDEMINQILGVAAPVRHEVKAAVLVAQVPQLDLSDLSDEVLEALERKAAQLPALEAHAEAEDGREP